MNQVAELLRVGRFEAAIALAARAAEAAPEAPDAWLMLAQAQLAARRPDAALAACDRGLAVAPGSAELACLKAAVLRSLARVDEALSLYDAVLAASPDHFEAGFACALLRLEAGDLAAAEAWLAGLDAHQVARAEARWLSARAAVAAGDVARARTELESFLARPDLSPARSADAWLLLAEALDGLGFPREAFAAVAKGKGLQRRLYAERAQGREAAAARFRRLAAWFAACDPQAWASAPPAAPRAAGHVFLVGFPRSGTTLLEQALAGHPRLVALEEAPTLAEAHAEFMGSDEGLQRLADITPEAAERWRGAYWAVVAGRDLDVTGRVFLDKAPAATEDLPLIAKLFPDATVLFALRDPRDVVLSCLRQNFQMNALTYAFTDLAAAAEAYAANMALAETYRRVLPLSLHEVRHEALVEEFAGGLAAICERIGLSFDPAMIDAAATARRRTVLTPSAAQVRAGLNAGGIGRWRAYAPGLSPILPTLEPWVRRFGYEA